MAGETTITISGRSMYQSVGVDLASAAAPRFDDSFRVTLKSAQTSLELTQVVWIDLQTLRATIPATDKLGDFDVEVSGPRGTSNLLVGAFQICADEDGDGKCDCVDGDRDGYGRADSDQSGCASQGDDCDDAQASIHPGAVEISDDAVDQDCSGQDAVTCLVDVDMDGFGSEDMSTTLARDGSCDTADQEATQSGDCDDASAFTYPGAASNDGTACMRDLDGDGFGDQSPPSGVVAGSDCDDLIAACTSDCTDADGDATAVCAGDCDDSPATGGTCVSGCAIFFADADGDGFGDPSAPAPTLSCVAPINHVANSGDCDDSVASCTSDCSNLDGDAMAACAGDCDDSLATGASCVAGCAIFFADTDGDGFGDLAAPTATGLCVPPANHVANSSDCDDAVASCTSDCSNLDGDTVAACAGDCDDSAATGASCSTGCTTFFADSDGDGFGDLNRPSATPSCVAPANHVANSIDCDDSVASCTIDCVNVDGDSLAACAGDCDDSAATGASCTVGCASFFADSDGDGFGDPASLSPATCVPPAAHVANNSDCDDGDADEFPGQLWFPDADGDLFGDSFAQARSCDRALVSDVLDDSDCDDSASGANPSVSEGPFGNASCSDTLDNDCDGFADETDTACLGQFATPTRIAELSSTAINAGPTLSADLLELYFRSDRAGGQGGSDIWRSTRASRSDPWGTPSNVTELNTSSNEFKPYVAGDGLTMVLTSDRTGSGGELAIWTTTRASRAAAWSTPVLVPELSFAGGSVGPSLDESQLRICLHRVSPVDLYEATRATVSDPWSAPQAIAELNTSSQDRAGFFGPGATVLYFTSGRPGGAGGNDLWVAARPTLSDPFGAPVNLSSLNSSSTDQDLWVAADGSYAIFASSRGGTLDLYESRVQ